MAFEIEPSSRAKGSPLVLALLSIVGFVWFRSKIKTPSKSIDSVRADDSIDQITNPPADHSRRGLLVTVTNCPPVPAQCSYPEKKHKRWYKQWKPYVFGLNLATFLAVAWYACVTSRMWKEMQAQTCIQQEASMNAERAWVGLEGTPQVEVSSLKETQFTAQINIALRNFGKGPAFNVFSSSRFANHGQVADAIQNSCNLIFPFVGLKPSRPVSSSLDSSKLQWGEVLFQGQIAFSDGMGTGGESSSVLGQEVFVVGCIVYKDQFQQPHWTKFSYSTGPLVSQVVRDASSFRHLYISSANNYTDDAEKEQGCHVGKPL